MHSKPIRSRRPTSSQYKQHIVYNHLLPCTHIADKFSYHSLRKETSYSWHLHAPCTNWLVRSNDKPIVLETWAKHLVVAVFSWVPCCPLSGFEFLRRCILFIFGPMQLWAYAIAVGCLFVNSHKYLYNSSTHSQIKQ